MKISILTATGEWGGAENHTTALATVLHDHGHEVCIVQLGHRVYEQNRAAIDQRIRIRYIELPQALEKLSWSESRNVLKQVPGDLCIFEKGELDTANFAFDLAAKYLFKSYIAIEQLVAPPMPVKANRYFLNGRVPSFGFWRYKVYLRRRSRSFAPDKIICVSEAVKTRLVNEYDFPATKTFTVHNGIDTTRFRPIPDLRSDVRQSWGIPEAATALGAVGRLSPIKGFDVAIRLFQRLCANVQRNDLWLVLVGDGPSKNDLRKLAEECGIGSRVLLPGGTDRPWQSYAALDFFLMTSHSEGLPFALLEAMACGCCPVAMGVGGIPEVISDPGLGWLATPGDEGAFFSNMREAVTADKAQLAEMRTKGRQTVLTRFNSEHQMGKIIKLVENGRGSTRSNRESPNRSQRVPERLN